MSHLTRAHQLETQITDALIDRWGYLKKTGGRSQKKHVQISGFDVLNPNSLPNISEQQHPPVFFYQRRDYNKLTENLFKQYNHAVSYKPVGRKNPVVEDSNPPPKSTIQAIEDKIEVVKNDIAAYDASNSLMEKFKLNRKLNRLFKSYHKANKQKSQVDQPKRATSLSTQNSVKFRQELRFKPPKLHFELTKEKKRVELQLDPFEPGNTESYMESKRVETKIRQEREVLQIYKSKVEETRRNSAYYHSLREIPQPAIQEKVEPDVGENFQIYQMDIPAPKERVDYEDLAAIRQKRHWAFTKVLRGRNPKYVRAKGTNFLVKYNQEEEARQMLSGKSKHQYQSSRDTVPRDQTSHTNDYDIRTMEGPPRKLTDQRDYETEFRNQKAEASLRIKKRHKID